MAILCLDRELELCAREGLHEFLKGEWALLFSHPQDFQAGSGIDRALRARQVRPLVVRRHAGTAGRCWIDELDEDSNFAPRLVHLKEPPFTAADAISFGARQLRGELLTRREGFVLIVDATLRRRGAFKYTSGRSAVSTLDLLASVDALRGQTGLGRAA